MYQHHAAHETAHHGQHTAHPAGIALCGSVGVALCGSVGTTRRATTGITRRATIGITRRISTSTTLRGYAAGMVLPAPDGASHLSEMLPPPARAARPYSPRRGDTHAVQVTPYKRSAVWCRSVVWCRSAQCGAGGAQCGDVALCQGSDSVMIGERVSHLSVSSCVPAPHCTRDSTPRSAHGVPPPAVHGAALSAPHGVPPSASHGAALSAPHGVPPSASHGVPPSASHGVPPSAPHGVPPSASHGVPPSASHGASPPAPHCAATPLVWCYLRLTARRISPRCSAQSVRKYSSLILTPFFVRNFRYSSSNVTL